MKFKMIIRLLVCFVLCVFMLSSIRGQEVIRLYETGAQVIATSDVIITKADIEKAGTSIPVSAIGEPVNSVKLYPPRWIEETESAPAYAVVEGSIFPVDPNGWPINFRVLLPASWSHRAVQSGGGGMNGMIMVREGRNPMINKGFAIYGSDAGHQLSGMGGPGGMQNKPLATGPTTGDEWALNEEAIRNLGYMQMKKTHDAAMVIVKRIYGELPLYNYYIGGSQGGREGLMVAQRYPADYDGIVSNVPIVNFSTLMLAPELIRIQEKPLANGVKSFGMWLPSITPNDFGMITNVRYKGQEGADENARVHSSLGVLGVTGFLMQNITANPLDYVEGGVLNKRREEISEWLDATNPDLSAFCKHGGKIIITIGTMDFTASSGAQLDYYQSLIDKMHRKKLDKFARIYVVPQGGHNLAGKSHNVSGEGKTVPVINIPAPNTNDQIDLIISWVEESKAPQKTLIINTEGRIGVNLEGKGFLLCSYPNYPRYMGGPTDFVSSYKSTVPERIP